MVYGPRIINDRFNYARRVNEMSDEELWFLDESGFNLHIAPLRCWSRVGRTPVQRVRPNRGVNVSLLMCISTEGVVFFVVKSGSFKAPDFIDFVEGLADRFPADANGDVCLVMDNAGIYHARDAEEFMVENGINHIFLPAYSPDLNPIENAFGVLKARYRSRGVAQTRAEMKRRIRDVIEEMNRELNPRAFYDHMRQYVELALNRESFN